jgi:hypothetical protein
LGKASAVDDEPPQHEDALPEGPKGAGILAGAEPFAMLVEQPGQVSAVSLPTSSTAV